MAVFIDFRVKAGLTLNTNTSKNIFCYIFLWASVLCFLFFFQQFSADYFVNATSSYRWRCWCSHFISPLFPFIGSLHRRNTALLTILQISQQGVFCLLLEFYLYRRYIIYHRGAPPMALVLGLKQSQPGLGSSHGGAPGWQQLQADIVFACILFMIHIVHCKYVYQKSNNFNKTCVL